MASTEEQRAKWREQNRARYAKDPTPWKKRANAYYAENKEKARASNKRWIESHRAEVAEYKEKWAGRNRERLRDQVLRRKYGITLEEYTVLLAAQGGVCWICQMPEGARTPSGQTPRTTLLALDHDHTTGRYRGLLCGFCNRVLGWGKDHPEWFDRASAYLRKETV